jgi:tetratricopeptide (TPR) repeat protein
MRTSSLLVLAAFTALSALAARPAPGEAPASGADAEIASIRAALRTNDVDGAVTLAEKAAADDPKSSALALWLGRAYGQKARKASILTQLSWAKKCKGAFERAVLLDPANLDARTDLISYLVNAPGLAGGDKAEARRQADEIRKRDAVRGHLAWGFVLEADKELPKAQAEYRSAAGSEGAEAAVRARAFWHLGLLLKNEGKTEDARAALREAVRLDPTHDRAKRELERLEKG